MKAGKFCQFKKKSAGGLLHDLEGKPDVDRLSEPILKNDVSCTDVGTSFLKGFGNTIQNSVAAPSHNLSTPIYNPLDVNHLHITTSNPLDSLKLSLEIPFGTR